MGPHYGGQRRVAVAIVGVGRVQARYRLVALPPGFPQSGQPARRKTERKQPYRPQHAPDLWADALPLDAANAVQGVHWLLAERACLSRAGRGQRTGRGGLLEAVSYTHL